MFGSPTGSMRRILSLGLVTVLGVSACAGESDTQTTTTPDPSAHSTDAETTQATPTPEPTETSGQEPGTGQETSAGLEEQGVSTGHPEATEAAAEVLASGGNAIDAAVTAAFAMGVVEPYASGIGGGGSVIISIPGEDPVFYDYREEINASGDIPASGVGVPGFTAGMDQLLTDHGSMSFAESVQPAQQLAQDGFEVTDFLQTRLTEDFGPEAVAGLSHFQGLEAGDLLVQSELADTLETLGEQGAESFYTGELQENLTAEVNGLDPETLASYEPVVSEPVSGAFGDYEVLGAPPALPGAAFIQLLQIAEAAGIENYEPASAPYIGTLSAAWEIALETTETQLGDQRFVDVDTESITDAEANAQRSEELSVSSNEQAAANASGAHTPGSLTDQAPAEVAPYDAELVAGMQLAPGMESSPNTTHISVVDSDGMAVSMTNTLTNFWGSQEYVDGYFLNNQLSRFGQLDSEANAPEPGKRSVTWSNPAMVMDSQGRPALIIGTPGGEQILSGLSNVVVQWGLQSRSLQEAINAPRFRLDPETNVLYAEPALADESAAAVEELGWELQIWPENIGGFGSVSALEVNYEEGTVSGADDPRRDGAHRILE